MTTHVWGDKQMYGEDCFCLTTQLLMLSDLGLLYGMMGHQNFALVNELLTALQDAQGFALLNLLMNLIDFCISREIYLVLLSSVLYQQLHCLSKNSHGYASLCSKSIFSIRFGTCYYILL